MAGTRYLIGHRHIQVRIWDILGLNEKSRGPIQYIQNSNLHKKGLKTREMFQSLIRMFQINIYLGPALYIYLYIHILVI